jgi:hypothetical protein
MGCASTHDEAGLVEAAAHSDYRWDDFSQVSFRLIKSGRSSSADARPLAETKSGTGISRPRFDHQLIYASMFATISGDRGSTITIWSPTKEVIVAAPGRLDFCAYAAVVSAYLEATRAVNCRSRKVAKEQMPVDGTARRTIATARRGARWSAS